MPDMLVTAVGKSAAVLAPLGVILLALLGVSLLDRRRDGPDNPSRPILPPPGGDVSQSPDRDP